MLDGLLRLLLLILNLLLIVLQLLNGSGGACLQIVDAALECGDRLCVLSGPSFHLFCCLRSLIRSGLCSGSLILGLLQLLLQIGHLAFHLQHLLRYPIQPELLLGLRLLLLLPRGALCLRSRDARREQQHAYYPLACIHQFLLGPAV
jgi:hypothetical protein